MKLLVLCAAYPDLEGGKSLAFAHERNLRYLAKGLDVVVLSFAAKKSYCIDEVSVLTKGDFEASVDKGSFDILVLHAANLRNHYTFLKKYGKLFESKVFFFHGHEVMHARRDYCRPYPYRRIGKMRTWGISAYDIAKMHVWHNYFIANESDQLVFVSEWMQKVFCKNTGIDARRIEGRSHIIPNCVGSAFEMGHYEWGEDKEYDFVTIRTNLDESKYCIDIVCDLAESNLNLSFLLVGKGEFFEHRTKPNNLTWIDKTLSHDEMVAYLQQSKCALMPTRVDAQGLAMCEMATFGIPLITSNIEVCSEVLANFTQVALIENDRAKDVDLLSIVRTFSPQKEKTPDFFAENTVQKEIDLYETAFRKCSQASARL